MFELRAFSHAKSAWVEIDRPVPVPVESLDYCVFNEDGRGFAPFEHEIPDWILPAWAGRGARLALQAESVRGEFADESAASRNERRLDLVRTRFGIRKDCLLSIHQKMTNFTSAATVGDCATVRACAAHELYRPPGPSGLRSVARGTVATGGPLT